MKFFVNTVQKLMSVAKKIEPQDIRYLYEQKIYNNRETVLFKPHQPYVLQLQ